MAEEGDRESRERIYAETRDDLLKRNLSNCENMDKAVLTLSSALLGLSLGFTKDVVSLENASFVWLLVSSWALFAAAIISTLMSFLSSQWGIRRQLVLAHEYYLEEKEEAFDAPNFWARATEFINVCSAALFVAAVIATVVFISLNL